MRERHETGFQGVPALPGRSGALKPGPGLQSGRLGPAEADCAPSRHLSLIPRTWPGDRNRYDVTSLRLAGIGRPRLLCRACLMGLKRLLTQASRLRPTTCLRDRVVDPVLLRYVLRLGAVDRPPLLVARWNHRRRRRRPPPGRQPDGQGPDATGPAGAATQVDQEPTE